MRYSASSAWENSQRNAANRGENKMKTIEESIDVAVVGAG